MSNLETQRNAGYHVYTDDIVLCCDVRERLCVRVQVYAINYSKQFAQGEVWPKNSY